MTITTKLNRCGRARRNHDHCQLKRIMWTDWTIRPHPNPKPLEKLRIVNGGPFFPHDPLKSHQLQAGFIQNHAWGDFPPKSPSPRIKPTFTLKLHVQHKLNLHKSTARVHTADRLACVCCELSKKVRKFVSNNAMHIPFSVSIKSCMTPLNRHGPGNSPLSKVARLLSLLARLVGRLDGENQSVFPYLCVWGLRISVSLKT